MDNPFTRSALLDAIQTGRRRFLERISEFTPEDLVAPGAVGKWSVKDLLAHILIHEQRMLLWVGTTLRGGTPADPQPYSMPEEDLNRLNEEIYLANRDRPLLEILRELDSAHARSLALVAAASETDLFDPKRFHLQEGEALWEAVAANTYQHEEEHTRDLDERSGPK